MPPWFGKFLFNRDLGVSQLLSAFFQGAGDSLADQQYLGDLVGDFRVCLEKRRFHNVDDACRLKNVRKNSMKRQRLMAQRHIRGSFG